MPPLFADPAIAARHDALAKALGPPPNPLATPTAAEAIPSEAYRDGTDFVIRIETAGVGKAGLKAEVRGGLLVVTVTKQASRPVGALPSWAELATGVFERSFALPTGADPSKVVVARQLGILEFRFPLTPTPFSVVTPIPI